MTNDKKKHKIVKRFIEKWRSRLFLQEWHLNAEYPNMPAPDAETGQSWDVIGETSASPSYMRAYIRLYPGYFKNTPKEQEYALVHELCHCITQEVWDVLIQQKNGTSISTNEITKTIERLTQRITNIAFIDQWEKK